MFLLQHPLLKLSWLILASLSSSAVAVANTKPHCQPTCGSLEIPYPFGIGEGCFMSKEFEITCNTSYSPPKPFLTDGNNTQLEVVDISPINSSNQVRIKNFVAYYCYNGSSDGSIPAGSSSINLSTTPYTFSTANKFTVIGCDTLALVQVEEGAMSGCATLCENMEIVTDGICSGIGCCQTPIPEKLKDYVAAIAYANTSSTGSWKFNPCGYAFLVDEAEYVFKKSYLAGERDALDNLKDFPVVLDWAIGNQTCNEARGNLAAFACHGNSTCHDSDNGPGYSCICNEGYEGNPYLGPGCQDIDECKDPNNNPCGEKICHNTPGNFSCTCRDGTHTDGPTCIPNVKKFPVIQFTLGFGLGMLALFAVISWLYLGIKKQKIIKLRQKYFEQNGGLLLQQHVAFRETAVDSTKLFTAQELEKATENYAESRIIGRGGNGIVYKGFLSNDRIVAIKKSKIVDESQIEQFINEVVILTQINHRNVVKLLGCCLETEVPLLVYEFVFNGSLFDHIHSDKRKYSVSWDNRLRIATETAAALAYLHSATSIPIIHRDIKSGNILLDENYTAKVSDFGTSRLIPLDQFQITTLVQGTLGYLDPEYFQTSQLTEKSDVYSFGIVLLELLTGQMPVSFERPEAERNLSSHCILSMKENRLFQVLEARVVKEGNEEQLRGVAELAKRCLKLKSEDRPTMREVQAELEGLRRFEQHPWVQATREENMGLLDGEMEVYPGGNSSLNHQNGVPSEQYSGQYNTENSTMLSMSIAFPR